MSGEENNLLVSRQGAVATLTLNRLERRNALDAALTRALLQALEQVDQDAGVRLVVLTGAGDRAFCAGGDLAADLAAGQDVRATLALYADLLQRMHTLGTPLLARVAGYCLGGGLGLALACDLVLASEDAVFGTPEVRAGMFPMIIAPLLVAHLGPKRAREMIFCARRIDAGEARELGLVNRVAAAGRLDELVAEVSADILAGSPTALSIGRRALARSAHLGGRQDAEELINELLEVLASEDAREGIQAFLQKRRPQWKGR